MITVHDPDLCEKLLGCKETKSYESACEDPLATLEKLKLKRSNISKRISSCSSENSAQTSRSNSSLYRTKEWLSRKSRRNVMLLPVDPELEVVLMECEAIQKRESDLIQELDSCLEVESSHNQSKKEMLFKQWSERVFEPIQQALRTNMELNGVCLDTQRRELFNKYLNTRNNKDIFLETLDSNEYNPLSLISSAIPAKTSSLQDPLTAQHTDYKSEQAVIRRCDMGVAPCKDSIVHGREDTDPVLWLAMELVQIDSSKRQRSRDRLKGSRNHSHFDENPEEGSNASEPQLPHKKPIHYERERLCLQWTQTD